MRPLLCFLLHRPAGRMSGELSWMIANNYSLIDGEPCRVLLTACAVCRLRAGSEECQQFAAEFGAGARARFDDRHGCTGPKRRSLVGESTPRIRLRLMKRAHTL
jgi:hypothetical protein